MATTNATASQALASLRERRMDGSLSSIEKLMTRREKLLVRVARLTDTIQAERRRIGRLAKHLASVEAPLPPAPAKTKAPILIDETKYATLKDRTRARMAAYRAQKAG